jgi:hypothetical protein
MNTYIAYLRVSTTRQGTTGVSLSEQRLAIARYSQTHNLRIGRWCTEVQTASRRRPVFDDILKALRTRQAAGLLVHKIDRGARNLTDWARLGEAPGRWCRRPVYPRRSGSPLTWRAPRRGHPGSYCSGFREKCAGRDEEGHPRPIAPGAPVKRSAVRVPR